MKIRGKNPTVSQRKILEKNDVNPDSWLISGIKRVKEDEIEENKRTRLGKDDYKVEEWSLVHRTNGMKKTIYID